ncbi:MAG: methyl-accepting chemotaxis protein [Lachnospiraceae bacterium]|nr:methyl-accepting chemotaxis protein [Lachnospiraceae bacterium]
MGVKDNKETRYKGLPSIKYSVMIMTVVTAVVAGVVLMIVAISNYSSTVTKLVQDEMKELAVAYGSEVDLQLKSDADFTVDDASAILKDVKLEDLSSSYAYLVDATGIMLYHPSPEKIGNQVENAAVKQLVSQLASGSIPQPDLIKYEFKGANKYASYYITQNGAHDILVITADESDVLAPIRKFRLTAIILLLVITIVAAAAVFVILSITFKPFDLIITILNKTSKFDLTHNPGAKELQLRADEPGQIARALHHMRNALRDMVLNINDTSKKLSENASALQEAANIVNDNSSDNSATTEELAAGMQETTATTENINENVADMAANAGDINNLAMDGVNAAEEIQKRATDIEQDVSATSDKIKRVFEDVKVKSVDAIEQSKAVNKINELTDTIKSIASQTNLLALNASIEAARAGESGRGFAVVAEEIGHLANQSAETVSGISDIVAEVHAAVNNMADCLNSTIDFVDTTVSEDYAKFADVSKQYNTDARDFENKMGEINNAVSALNGTIGVIKDSVSNINETIGDSANGITDVAQRTTDIVKMTETIYEQVNESVTFSEELSDIVKQFDLGDLSYINKSLK